MLQDGVNLAQERQQKAKLFAIMKYASTGSVSQSIAAISRGWHTGLPISCKREDWKRRSPSPGGYFSDLLVQILTKSAQALASPVSWEVCELPLGPLQAIAEGHVFDCAPGTLQVNAANKYEPENIDTALLTSVTQVRRRRCDGKWVRQRRGARIGEGEDLPHFAASICAVP
jgi:hypothetical protein